MPSTQHPDSYWVETGNPAPVLPAIAGDRTADVVIVGAGFTGLSAAYHLSQAGIGAIVVEAEDVGWGASGRNGGMLPPRYKKGFASIAKTYGNESRVGYTPSFTKRSIRSRRSRPIPHWIADFPVPARLPPRILRRILLRLRSDCAWMAAEAGDRAARILSRSEMVDEVGANIHVGGWFDPRGAAIHPLNYVRGLAPRCRNAACRSS